MSTMVAEMTKEEFKEMLDELIEQKLVELFGNPDVALQLNDSVRARLIKQRKAISTGERGTDLRDVISDIEKPLSATKRGFPLTESS